METVGRLSVQIKALQDACAHPVQNRNSAHAFYRNRDSVIEWCRECNGIVSHRPV